MRDNLRMPRPSVGAFLFVWCLAAVMGVAFWGVVIWAIIKIVSQL